MTIGYCWIGFHFKVHISFWGLHSLDQSHLNPGVRWPDYWAISHNDSAISSGQFYSILISHFMWLTHRGCFFAAITLHVMCTLKSPSFVVSYCICVSSCRILFLVVFTLFLACTSVILILFFLYLQFLRRLRRLKRQNKDSCTLQLLWEFLGQKH